MSLEQSISRTRRLQRIGRWLAAILLAAALASAVLLLAGLLDVWLAFESSPRTILVGILVIIVAGATIAFLGIATRFSKQRAASVADFLLGSPRSPASAALSLGASPETPLAEFLAGRARESAAADIAAIPASRVIPWRAVGIALLALILAALPLGILTVIFPEAVGTVAARLLHPSADLPPWSKMKFAVSPNHPSAVYGGEVQLAVEITGGIPTEMVELLIRRPGEASIQRLPSFRESGTRFSRTLDSLTEPVFIAFASGKARSNWHEIELLLQPKVLSGNVRITPPSYTGREAISSPLDSNEIHALEGSEIILSLTSNRPLSSSALVFTPATVPGEVPAPEEIRGEISSADTIAFRWTAGRAGTLSAQLRDVRGTPAAVPLELVLKAVPDQAPLVDLNSPPRFLLATPSSSLEIKGTAEDDFALAKVRLVRTLAGFRDRSRTVAPALQEKEFNFGDKLPLYDLGVIPGQVIELFLEASDHNPSLLGQGSSEISRIQIITEEDYAQRIRAKTTLEQFNARYRAIAEALRNSKESLEALRKDPTEEARAAAEKAHADAADLLEKLANDFPAFQAEERLKKIAENAAADALANLDELQNFDPEADAEENEKAIAGMLERLGAREQEQQQLQQDAELMAEAGTILEMAARFRQIYQTQQSLTERIRTIAEEIHKGNDQNRRLLKSLADTQDKNREALDEFAKELESRAAKTTRPELDEMIESTKQFLQDLRMSDPQSVMKAGAESGRLGSAEDAYVQAELARALLERLMEKPEPFPSACKGQGMQFSSKFPDVNATMQQLLEGLMSQNPGYNPGSGQGGGGMGGGGTGPTGNAAPGFGMADVAVLGPERLMFEPASLGGSADGKGGPGKVDPLTQASETESMAPSEIPEDTLHAPDPQSVPEPYREAVKKYFTP